MIDIQAYHLILIHVRFILFFVRLALISTAALKNGL